MRPLIDGLPAFRRICEAIESAERSFFATIAFVHTDFVMPDDRGSLFDVLDRAAARGLDVRVIFWQSDPAAGIPRRGLVAPIDSLLTERYFSDVLRTQPILPARHEFLGYERGRLRRWAAARRNRAAEPGAASRGRAMPDILSGAP